MGLDPGIAPLRSDEGQALLPDPFQRIPDRIEIPTGDLGLQVRTGGFDASEGRCRLDQVRSPGPETEENIVARHRLHHIEVIVGLDGKMPAETGWKALSLINPVNGIAPRHFA